MEGEVFTGITVRVALRGLRGQASANGRVPVNLTHHHTSRKQLEPRKASHSRYSVSRFFVRQTSAALVQI
jgi:hypothetical protein